MSGTGGDGGLQRLFETRRGLPRQSEDEIETGANSGSRGDANRLERLRAPMHASERTQLVIMKRLHADADAIDSERSPEGHSVRIHILGIRLDGKLGVVVDRQTARESRHDAREILARRPRRRPAAEEDAVDALPIRTRLDLRHQRLGVLILQPNVRRNRKRTIRAVNAAKREVDVEAEGHYFAWFQRRPAVRDLGRLEALFRHDFRRRSNKSRRIRGARDFACALCRAEPTLEAPPACRRRTVSIPTIHSSYVPSSNSIPFESLLSNHCQ